MTEQQGGPLRLTLPGPGVIKTPVFMRRFFQFVLGALAVGYVAALLASVLALRLVGERWWITLVGLYVPRLAFAIPLPFLVLALLVWGPRRLLWTQVLALALVVIPLMGLAMRLSPVQAAATSSLRILTFNIHQGHEGIPNIRAQVTAVAPNIVVFQENTDDVTDAMRPLFVGWHIHTLGQFLLASRFPIHDVYLPPKLPGLSPGIPDRSARFIRYTLDTPLGLVDLYNVHPISPREGLDTFRGDGFRAELATGRLWIGPARREIDSNSQLRRRQVETWGELSRQSDRPVIVAGDTNLPGLSWVVGHFLSHLQDGFASAGVGFGYTFPSHHPWMRIDRVLVNDRLRFADFQVGQIRASDHLSVSATLVAADRR